MAALPDAPPRNLVAGLGALWRYHWVREQFFVVRNSQRQIYVDPGNVPERHKTAIDSFSFESASMTRAQFDRLPDYLKHGGERD